MALSYLHPAIVKAQSPTIRKFFRSWARQEQQICISGPRNCAKSFHILGYMFAIHSQVPNLKTLVLRTEYTTIAGTAFATIKEKLLRYDIDDPRNPFRLYGGTQRPQVILFDNGGQMTFAGMDNASKILGRDYDIVFYNQVERELRQQTWSDLIGGQAGARSGNWNIGGQGFWQIIGDANPTSPFHWIYQMKEDENNTNLHWYDFKHRDHPLFYDWNRGDYTPKGRETRLDLLTAYPPGHTRDRMVYGRWVAAAGVVYPQFNRAKHERFIDRDEIPPYAKWYISADWGGRSPHAIGFYATYDDQIVLFKEIYKQEVTVAYILSQAKTILEDYAIEPVWMFVDHNTEHALQCEQAGLPVQLADKEVLGGIECVQNTFGSGKILLNSDSLIEEDMTIDGSKRLRDELVEYAYPEERQRSGTMRDEYPIKKNDHACDHLRYLVMSLQHAMPDPVQQPLTYAA